MNQRTCYKVGDHIFALTISEELRRELKLLAFEPFKIETAPESLFEVEVVETIDDQIREPIIVDAPLSSSGMPRVDIHRVNSGLLYQITMPYNDAINAVLVIDDSRHTTRVALYGSSTSKLAALNNALILSYITFTMKHSTLLLHSSTVIHQGHAYLFLGKSGTGKSTHSRMWLESFEGSELLNDDHPIIRVFDDGTITVYGSPWSGKTPCYRNLTAPLGAIVRIERGFANEIERLRPLKAYASITTSCSGAQWSKSLMNDKVKAVEKVISLARSYTIRCLPNHEAAEVCYNFIKNDK